MVRKFGWIIGAVLLIAAGQAHAATLGDGNLDAGDTGAFAPPGPFLAPGQPGFIHDYDFTVSPPVSFLTSVVNVPLSEILNIAGLSASLLDVSTSAILVNPVFAGLDGSLSLSYAGFNAADTYRLRVAGSTTGSFGGFYAGVFSVSTVPLPAALPLFGAGLAALALIRRRRKRIGV